MKTVLLWLGIVACLFGGAVLEGVRLAAFWNPHLALIVFGPVVAYALYFGGALGLASFLRRLIGGDSTVDDMRLMRHLAVVGAMAGICAFLLGTVHTLQNAADFPTIARGLSVAALGLFYGALPALFGFAAFRGGSPRLALATLKPRERASAK